MTITREWLSWDKPCLPQAAASIVDRFAEGSDAGESDLRDMMCVLPGARAGRLLLGMLLRECSQRRLRLVPPRVLTPGAMVDEALDVGGPIASGVESHLAWIEALRSSTADELRPLLPESPPPDDLAAWDDLAGRLARLHDELAGGMRSFSDAADAVERMERIVEGERWRVIDSLRAKQREALAHAGLIDRHDAREAALRQAIRAGAEGRLPGHRIVLIGVADLNALHRAALGLTAFDVTALVHAPATMTDAFDELGMPRVEAWRTRLLEIPDASIVVAERPVDIAQQALQAVADVADRYAASQITLGLGDASLHGDLSTAAQWAGLSVHDPAGLTLAHTAPWRLLDAASDWIDDQHFEHFATLLRHPDVERLVIRTADAGCDTPDSRAARGREEWLTLLDEYFEDHLQGRFTGRWLGEPARQQRLKAVYDAVQALLQPLTAAKSKSRRLGEWCQTLLDVLANVYAIDSDAEGGEQGNTNPAALESIDACLALRNALTDFHTIAPDLQPMTTAATALRVLLNHIAGEELSVPSQPGAIESLGWLELHLDPAPALVILGVNDGWIPASVTADAFLPDGLRRALGLLDNDRRYARDAYLLEAMRNSRESLRLVVGRRGPEGDPLTPSRLLLACDDSTLVRRVIDFTDDRSQRPALRPRGLAAPGGAKSSFIVPPLPRSCEIPQAMSVTAFKAFLNCPYRFALERLLCLKERGDDGDELDPMAFGSLAHEVLCTLKDDAAVRDCDDRQLIFDFLQGRLKEIVRDTFGDSPLTALRVQIARLEQRLWSFAAFQANSVREGWRIRHCEVKFDRSVALEVPGQEPMPLIGKIDRIDENITTGEWRVIDYKTGDSAKSPAQVHHERKKIPEMDEHAWVDLQLPLYHLLVTQGATKLPAERVRLGYIVLPRQRDGVQWIEAEWESEQLEHALETARDVVRRLRAGEFDVDRMSDDVDAEFDPFVRICQTTAFSAKEEDREGDEEGGGE